MATTSNMFLYSLTIQQPTAITKAIVGQFLGTKEQQILTVSGSRVSILRFDTDTGKTVTLLSQDVFSIIRSAAAFCLAGSSKDYVILGTDSGRIAILQYEPTQNRLCPVHLETFGRSGVRRVVPGQYLAVDPKGRACLIASVEKNKLVYVLNRDAEAALTISSPLEAHKAGTIVFSLVALDVGYANPVFAAIEANYVDFEETDETAAPTLELVYYELDLGLNHVVRAWSESVDGSSSMLFAVPGGSDGPGGVLVCGEGHVAYRHANQTEPRFVSIPRRRGATEDPQRKRTIVAGTMHKLKHGADAFFFLLQTEDGDLFKVMLEEKEEQVQSVKMHYFDTIPVATSLCILKSGFLFAASEFGNHGLYQFETLGEDDDDDDVKASENMSGDLASLDQQLPVYFHPHPLTNLTLVGDMDSMNPLMDAVVMNGDDEESPEFVTACGNGARSRLCMLKHGLAVRDTVASTLPGAAQAVWTTKLAQNDRYDAYMVLASSSETLVMRIGEEVVCQVTDSGILTSVTTLAIQQMGDEGIVQVHPKGIRHIRTSEGNTVDEWPAPPHRSIVAAAANQRQVVIALSSGEVVYFEMDTDGSLAEFDTKRQMAGTVTCLGLGKVPEGRLRSSVLAIGCDDCTVRIVSLDPGSTLEDKSIQALTAAPSSLVILSMDGSVYNGHNGQGTHLYLHIGLHSGVYLRTFLDDVTGELTDTQNWFLGLKSVKLFEVHTSGQTCLLALSARPWMGHVDPVRGFVMTPLLCGGLDWAWPFSSPQCEEGIIGVCSTDLRIFTVENLQQQQQLVRRSIPLTYTPRHIVRHPNSQTKIVYTVEADNHTLSPFLCDQLLADEGNADRALGILPPAQFGYPRGVGRWASAISVVDLAEEKVLQRVDFDDNEAAVAAVVVSFASRPQDEGSFFLVVGTGKDMVVHPRQCTAGFLYVFRIAADGKHLTLVHKTTIEEPPTALLAFQGRLLVAMGKILRIYDMGLRQLLRKCQTANDLPLTPHRIVSLQTQGNRIVVGDVQHGITVAVYHRATNRIVPLVDDVTCRWTTCTAMVDYASVAGGDKFGNLWIVRCPNEVREDEENYNNRNARRYLHGAPHRLDLVAHFCVHDIPTSISKTQEDILVWTGLQGTVGALVPLLTRQDADLFHALETLLRTHDPSPVGRDHLLYRGYYAPAKGVIDGDLCERFRLLSCDKKAAIAEELGRSIGEVERKISDVRMRSTF